VKVWPIATAAVSVVLIAGTAVGAGLAPASRGGGDVGSAPVRIGVALKGLDNPFFLAIYEGIRREAARRGVPATVRSVPSSDDVDGEAAQLRALVAAMKDCYVVNPITGTNLLPPLRGVSRPIINIDSPIDSMAAARAHVRIRSYIGTDDFAAGRVGGGRMARLLRGRGTVALVGGLAESINSGLRLSGFERGIQGTRVRVVARVNADYDRTQAEIAAERILRTHPRISGFFAANDLMALGIADAVGARGKTGMVKIIGMDGIAEALDAVRSGSLDATVSQYPYVMGKMAVEACAAAARDARLPARVDAPIALLTKANVGAAIAAFPRPVHRYSDPFSRLLRP
jgi:ABC-type sugar transport system substrate-binding protein